MNVLAIGCHPDDLEIGCGGPYPNIEIGGNYNEVAE